MSPDAKETNLFSIAGYVNQVFSCIERSGSFIPDLVHATKGTFTNDTNSLVFGSEIIG